MRIESGFLARHAAFRRACASTSRFRGDVCFSDVSNLLRQVAGNLAFWGLFSARLIADAKETGEAVRADITNKAQEEANAMIEKARVAIEAEKQAAMSELQNSVADLSVDVASRLVSNDLSDAEHRAIIERYINEAGSFHAN